MDFDLGYTYSALVKPLSALVPELENRNNSKLSICSSDEIHKTT